MLNVVQNQDQDVQSEARFSYIDELFNISVEPKYRPYTKIRVRSPGPDTPLKNPYYTFTKEHLRLLQFWLNDDVQGRIKNNLMTTGPTGSGKTTLIEQLAARTGFGSIKVGCHADLEFEDLIGRYVLNAQGGLVWSDGPVVRAMREGQILLFDEINFLRPEVVGSMNTILDGGSYLITTTGERVLPHRDFRIAATGNAIDGTDASKYRGVNKQNDALLDRFLIGIQLDYMGQEQEQDLLVKMHPVISPQVVEVMMEVAKATRIAQKAHDMSVSISTRVLLEGWGRQIVRYGNTFDTQVQNLLSALQASMLFRVPAADRAAIETTITNYLQKKGYIKSEKP